MLSYSSRVPGELDSFYPCFPQIYLFKTPPSPKMIHKLRECVRVFGVADARTCTPTVMPILGAFPESFACGIIAYS